MLFLHLNQTFCIIYKNLPDNLDNALKTIIGIKWSMGLSEILQQQGNVMLVQNSF